MAGRDQSVDLSGMLSQIAKTTGEMGKAYEPVMKAATKPRGSMDDPEHLQRLAQWATNNGDSAGASMYMQQSRQARSEKKEKQALDSMAATSGMRASAQRAIAEGNVQELQRITNALGEKAANPTSTQGFAAADSALQFATKGMSAAEEKQTDNRANAIMKLDALIEAGVDQNGNPVNVAGLQRSRDELAKFEGVSTAVGEKQMEAWDQERQLIEAEANQYVAANSDKLYAAIESGDNEAQARIIAEAPAAARPAMQAKADTEREYVRQMEERDYLFAETSVPFDMKSIQADVNALPEQYHAQFSGILTRMEGVEKYRINNTLPDGKQIEYKNLRKELEDEFKAVARSQGNADYQRALSDNTTRERGIADIQVKLANIEITPQQVEARAEELARLDGDEGLKIEGRGARRRTVLNISAYMEDARNELEQAERDRLNNEMAIRYPDAPGVVAPGGPTTNTDVSRGASVNETRTDADGVKWTWDGTKWNRA